MYFFYCNYLFLKKKYSFIKVQNVKYHIMLKRVDMKIYNRNSGQLQSNQKVWSYVQENGKWQNKRESLQALAYKSASKDKFHSILFKSVIQVSKCSTNNTTHSCMYI